MVRVTVLLAGLLCAAPIAQAQTGSPPTNSAPATATGATPGWKKVFENSQAIYFVGEAPADPAERQVLLQFKVPQVVDGAQVWSVVSRMKVSCGDKRMATLENKLYALRMGTGPVVQTQAVNDPWHQPQPGSLGGLIWGSVCAQP